MDIYIYICLHDTINYLTAIHIRYVARTYALYSVILNNAHLAARDVYHIII